MSNLDNSRSHSFVVCIRHIWHWPICVAAVTIDDNHDNTEVKFYLYFLGCVHDEPAWWPLARAGYVGRRSSSAYHFISFQTWTAAVIQCPVSDIFFRFVSAFSLFNVMCGHLPISSINSRRCQTQAHAQRTHPTQPVSHFINTKSV